jgi:hypothetical protein
VARFATIGGIPEPLQVQKSIPNLRGQYGDTGRPIEAAMSMVGRQSFLTVISRNPPGRSNPRRR